MLGGRFFKWNFAETRSQNYSWNFEFFGISTIHIGFTWKSNKRNWISEPPHNWPNTVFFPFIFKTPEPYNIPIYSSTSVQSNVIFWLCGKIRFRLWNFHNLIDIGESGSVILVMHLSVIIFMLEIPFDPFWSLNIINEFR